MFSSKQNHQNHQKKMWILSTMQDVQCFQKKKKKDQIFLPSNSWKKHPQKLHRKTQIHFFFLTASSAQTEEFMFQNVAYWSTVYRHPIKT